MGLPTKPSAAEIAAGTGANKRQWTPADIKAMIDAHGGGGGGGGTAGVDEVVGRRYGASATSLLLASQFTMVADRMYTFFRPIPTPKTYAKISAIFGPDGTSFSAGAQARLGAYVHLVGAPSTLIDQVLITDATLTGDTDVLADMVLPLPAVAPGIFLTVMADRALKLAMMNEDGLSTLSLLDTKFTPGSSPIDIPASIDFSSQPSDASQLTVACDNGGVSHKFNLVNTPGSPPAGESDVQIGATVAITVANLKVSLDVQINSGAFAGTPCVPMPTAQVNGILTNGKLEVSSATDDVTMTDSTPGGPGLNAVLTNESSAPAVSAKADPQFMLQRDLGAFGNLPDPHGSGTLQPVVSSIAAPGIMLEP